jgi:hypothetical protein
MAHRTVFSSDLSVNALSGGHPRFDLVVTHEAPGTVDVEVGVVAILTSVGVFKALVGGAQRSGELDITSANGADYQNRKSYNPQEKCPPPHRYQRGIGGFPGGPVRFAFDVRPFQAASQNLIIATILD